MSHLHELVKSSVMLFIIVPMYTDIISDLNHAYTAVQDLVHHPLEDVLGTGEAPHKSVASPWHVECCHGAAFAVQYGMPIPRLGI